MVQAARVLDLALGEAQKAKLESDAAKLGVEQWKNAHEELRAERDLLKDEIDGLKEIIIVIAYIAISYYNFLNFKLFKL